MKNRFKIRLLPTLALFSIISLTGCDMGTRTQSTDHFVFEINTREKFATVIGLTELGREQEVLAVPTFVENYPVQYIGKRAVLGDRLGVLLLTGIQKKIYLPPSLINRVGLAESSVMDAILNVANPSEELINSIQRFYESNLYILTEDTKLNTFFMLNFDSAGNEGYYWMDYINGSNPYIIPADPVRDGYTFDGWYYEEECTTLWHNQVPASETENLTLYAKWL
jgi:uncharacterized repeat protein (TIGR02543 family)